MYPFWCKDVYPPYRIIFSWRRSIPTCPRVATESTDTWFDDDIDIFLFHNLVSGCRVVFVSCWFSGFDDQYTSGDGGSYFHWWVIHYIYLPATITRPVLSDAYRRLATYFSRYCDAPHPVCYLYVAFQEYRRESFESRSIVYTVDPLYFNVWCKREISTREERYIVYLVHVRCDHLFHVVVIS